jgi:hypothetical protein
MTNQSKSFDKKPHSQRHLVYGPVAMSHKRTVGLSSGEAVLGLVIEQSDSASDLGKRLVERFSSAQFTRSAVHNALKRLVGQGLVMRVERASGSQEAAHYEATSRGVLHFSTWLQESTSAAPPLREELQAKVEFCAPCELPRLIDAVCAEEEACASMFAAAQGRVSEAELIGTSRASDAERWSILTRTAMLRDEAAMWGMRFKRLERLHARLEELRAEARRCGAPPGE